MNDRERPMGAEAAPLDEAGAFPLPPPALAPYRAEPLLRVISEEDVAQMLALFCWAHAPLEVALEKARHAVQQMISAGLPFEGPEGARTFDPTEVVNFMKRFGSDARVEGAWRGWVETGRRYVTELPSTLQHVRFVLRREVPHLPPGRAHRLRLPLPLDGAGHHIRRVEPLLPLGISNCITRVDRNRLELRMDAPPDPEGPIQFGVAVELELSAALRREWQQTPGDLELYLRPKEGLIQVDQEVVALAQRLSGSAQGVEAIRAFWSFLFERLAIGLLHHASVDRTQPLRSILGGGWADCLMGSALLASLCRARAMPARLLAGRFLYPPGPTTHYWCEVWIPDQGWLPFDLMSWDLAAGRRDSRWSETFLGRLEPRIVYEVLPRDTVGPMGIAIPPWWLLTTRRTERGAQIRLSDRNHQPLLTDEAEVTWSSSAS